MSLLYAGLDVSLEMTSICVVDADGRIVLESKVPSDPEAIAGRLGELPGELSARRAGGGSVITVALFWIARRWSARCLHRDAARKGCDHGDEYEQDRSQ